MKSILMSIKPQFVDKILNGEKTIEIRKRFPKDYVGWVYIYCTKGKPNLYRHFKGEFLHLKETNASCLWNGKVVARFWCNKVEKICLNEEQMIVSETMYEEQLLKAACLTVEEIDEYLEPNEFEGYAIHISDLEIFDKPKEINEFYKYSDKFIEWYTGLPKVRVVTSLTRSPQSWCYIEINNEI